MKYRCVASVIMLRQMLVGARNIVGLVTDGMDIAEKMKRKKIMLSKICTDIIDIMLNLDEKHRRFLFAEALKLQMQQTICNDKGVEYKTSNPTHEDKVMNKTIQNETTKDCMNMVKMFSEVKDMPDVNKAAIALFMYYDTHMTFTEKRYDVRVVQKELTPEEFLRMHFPSVSYEDTYKEYKASIGVTQK